mmetsp:Transcript_28009/g.55121  ORF Transcript_28009/g.55121 Transcript_28009/m.55121 type:complete len:342 (+) Transcript_28009:60-1085(+)
MKCVVSVVLLCLVSAPVVAQSWADCSPQSDGHPPNNSSTLGPFAKTSFLNATFNKKPLYGLFPSAYGTRKFPALLFMHGSTGQWEMYQPNLELYASHGFVVIFPFIKSPEKDKNPLTTNTDGTYLLEALDFATAANKDPTSPLFGKVDLDNVVLAGHSMGATCSIAAGKRVTSRPGNGGVKLVITQHPGVCGPFGPPPLPATWMPSDLETVINAVPVLFTTATNDGAFWPAPQTATHEWGCFNKTMAMMKSTPNPSIFAQFSKAACLNDNKRLPFDDSGHNCPFKNNVETPWVTTAIKLYAHLGGSTHTKCSQMLYGQGEASLSADPAIDHAEIHPPPLRF